MSIGSLEYSKDWTSPSDFPAVEPNEAQARQDMQYLFDEVKRYINTILIPGLKGLEITNFQVDAEGRFVFTDANKATHAYDVGKEFVSRVYLNGSGELVIEFIDGTTSNLGKIGGSGTSVTLSSSVTSNSTTTAANSYAVKQAYDKASAAVPKSGGTMTGALTLSGAPTSDLHAATKKYVDELMAGGSGSGGSAAGVTSGTLSTVATAAYPVDDSKVSATGEWTRVGNLVFVEITVKMTLAYAGVNNTVNVSIGNLPDNVRRCVAFMPSTATCRRTTADMIWNWSPNQNLLTFGYPDAVEGDVSGGKVFCNSSLEPNLFHYERIFGIFYVDDISQ